MLNPFPYRVVASDEFEDLGSKPGRIVKDRVTRKPLEITRDDTLISNSTIHMEISMAPGAKLAHRINVTCNLRGSGSIAYTLAYIFIMVSGRRVEFPCGMLSTLNPA